LIDQFTHPSVSFLAIMQLSLSFALLLGSTGASSQWHQMPNGMYYHEECIHQFDEHYHVLRRPDGSAHVTTSGPKGEEVPLPPCPHKPRNGPSELTAQASQAAEVDVSYYSSWSVYAKMGRSEGFGFMNSSWDVPAAPTGRGPLGQSSVYLFNGLEDGGGHKGESTLILQPVLQYGKSGCLINPLKWDNWWMTSYMVDGSGRAYCGKNLGPLQVGERVWGAMTLTEPETNTWQVDSTRVSTGELSTHSVTLGSVVIDAAYATMEGMIIYNCQAYPDSNSCAFEENKLADREGAPVKASWEKVIEHGECAQDVQLPASDEDPIVLVWDASIKASEVIV
jgi:hypothetical protein